MPSLSASQCLNWSIPVPVDLNPCPRFLSDLLLTFAISACDSLFTTHHSPLHFGTFFAAFYTRTTTMPSRPERSTGPGPRGADAFAPSNSTFPFETADSVRYSQTLTSLPSPSFVRNPSLDRVKIALRSCFNRVKIVLKPQ
jgi:hypothetical protein